MRERRPLLAPLTFEHSLWQTTSLVLIAVSLTVSACMAESSPTGSSGGVSGMAGAGAAAAGGSRDFDGTITVSLREAVDATPASSLVRGVVYDGPVPTIVPLVVEREENGCQLLKAKVPFCGTPCGSTEACVENDTCAPYPKAQNVGVIRVSGLGPADLMLDPVPPSFTYQSLSLPYPPCAEGAEVRLSADSFSAQSRCVAPLFVSKTNVLSVQRDRALELAWDPPTDPTLARVLIRLDISHHGGKKGEIACDVPDTGAFQIPASLVTALIDLGLAGYPSVIITRITSAKTSEHSRLVFAVSASVERNVDTGITSCTRDADCPAGQKCDVKNLTCQ